MEANEHALPVVNTLIDLTYIKNDTAVYYSCSLCVCVCGRGGSIFMDRLSFNIPYFIFHGYMKLPKNRSPRKFLTTMTGGNGHVIP